VQFFFVNHTSDPLNNPGHLLAPFILAIRFGNGLRGLKVKLKRVLDAVETYTPAETSCAHISSNAMDLDGEVRQRAEPRQLRPIVVRSTRLVRVDGHYRPEVARPQPPEMKAGDFVAVTLDRLSKVVRHGTIRVHVQQNSPCVTDQAK
jgi:hypothetical protein